MKKLIILLLTALLSVTAIAEQLPRTKLISQWDEPIVVDETIKMVIFAADKERGNWVKNALDSLKITDLAAKKWVYVADISAMPSLITKLFAMPKMKKYAFSIGLDKEGEVTKDWPKVPEQVSVYFLDQLGIKSVKHFVDEASLTAFLGELL